MHARCPIIRYSDGGTCPWPASERLSKRKGGYLVCRDHAPQPWRLVQYVLLAALGILASVLITLTAAVCTP